MKEGKIKSSPNLISIIIKYLFIYPAIVSIILLPLTLILQKIDNKFSLPITILYIICLLVLRYYYRKRKKSKTAKKKFQASPNSVILNTQTGSIVLNNPFRGIMVVGAAGSGKTESIGVPLMEQFIKQKYSGVIYDFKFPTLANDAAWFASKYGLNHYFLDFNNPYQSYRVNPLKPEYMPNTSYAREYAQAIISNLMKESITKPDFWSRSATDLLTACIWYLKEERPDICDIPHVFSMITSHDEALISKLHENVTTRQMTISIYNAMQRGADNQVSGVIGTLQGLIAQINTPELMYIFSQDDFSLDINNPLNPILLTVGSYPTLTTTFAPLCSLVITVVAKLMNQPNKAPSFVLLDEAPTIFINSLDTLPNTGRSNKISTVIMCQDLAQLRDGYGKEKSDVLFAACNNHFYGRVSSSYTSEVLSKQFGKIDKTYVTANTGTSMGKSFGSTKGQSETIQERDAIKPSEFLTLEVGEFAGIAVESNVSMFKKKFFPVERMPLPILPKFEEKGDIYEYYNSVRTDIDQLLGINQ